MVVERNCGWDITDYGLSDFDNLGLFLFTVRNGNNADLGKGRGMLYAEKAMISRQNQYSPMHRHNLKAEDIINRGGGTLVIELFGDTDGRCDGSKGTKAVTTRGGMSESLRFSYGPRRPAAHLPTIKLAALGSKTGKIVNA